MDTQTEAGYMRDAEELAGEAARYANFDDYGIAGKVARCLLAAMAFYALESLGDDDNLHAAMRETAKAMNAQPSCAGSLPRAFGAPVNARAQELCEPYARASKAVRANALVLVSEYLEGTQSAWEDAPEARP